MNRSVARLAALLSVGTLTLVGCGKAPSGIATGSASRAAARISTITGEELKPTPPDTESTLGRALDAEAAEKPDEAVKIIVEHQGDDYLGRSNRPAFTLRDTELKKLEGKPHADAQLARVEAIGLMNRLTTHLLEAGRQAQASGDRAKADQIFAATKKLGGQLNHLQQDDWLKLSGLRMTDGVEREQAAAK